MVKQKLITYVTEKKERKKEGGKEGRMEGGRNVILDFSWREQQ